MNENIIGANNTKVFNKGNTVVDKVPKAATGHVFDSLVVRVQIVEQLSIRQ